MDPTLERAAQSGVAIIRWREIEIFYEYNLYISLFYNADADCGIFAFMRPRIIFVGYRTVFL